MVQNAVDRSRCGEAQSTLRLQVLHCCSSAATSQILLKLARRTPSKAGQQAASLVQAGLASSVIAMDQSPVCTCFNAISHAECAIDL